MEKYNFKNESLVWKVVEEDKKLSNENPFISNKFLLLKSLNKKQIEQIEKELLYIEESIYQTIQKHPEYITSDEDYFEIPESLISSGKEITNSFCNGNITTKELLDIQKQNYIQNFNFLTIENKEEIDGYNIKNLKNLILQPINEKIEKIKEANIFNEKTIQYLEDQKQNIINAIEGKTPYNPPKKELKEHLISVALRELGYEDHEISTHQTLNFIEHINYIKKFENITLDFKDYDDTYIENYKKSPINNVQKLKLK